MVVSAVPFLMASLSRNESVENAQHVLERFWSLIEVTGLAFTVVNT